MITVHKMIVVKYLVLPQNNDLGLGVFGVTWNFVSLESSTDP